MDISAIDIRWIHIAAGLVSIAAGAVALAAAKGASLHRRSGLVFAVAMFVMTASAVIVATYLRPNPGNVVAGTLTFYLVATGLLTVRPPAANGAGIAAASLLVALAVGAAAIALGVAAMQRANGSIDGIPAGPLFLFGGVAALAAIGDARTLSRGAWRGAPKIARHLWRMTFAMWVATTSLFLGQPRVFPEALRHAIGLRAIPVLLVTGLLAYWLARTLRGRAPRRAVHQS